MLMKDGSIKRVNGVQYLMALNLKIHEPPKDRAELMGPDEIHCGAYKHAAFLKAMGMREVDPIEAGYINSHRAYYADTPDFKGYYTTDYNHFWGALIRKDRMTAEQREDFERIMLGDTSHGEHNEFERRLHKAAIIRALEQGLPVSSVAVEEYKIEEVEKLERM